MTSWVQYGQGDNPAIDINVTSEYTVSDEVDFAERDATELAERYATFYNELQRRGVWQEHALSLTSDLLYREQEQPFINLPAIEPSTLEVDIRNVEEWINLLQKLNDFFDATDTHGLVYRDHETVQALRVAASQLSNIEDSEGEGG